MQALPVEREGDIRQTTNKATRPHGFFRFRVDIAVRRIATDLFVNTGEHFQYFPHQPTLLAIFSGRQQSLCDCCGAVDHYGDQCDQHAASEVPERTATGGAAGAGGEPPKKKPKKGGTCNNFNSKKGCTYRGCKYEHVCSTCAATDHGAADCP